MVTNASVGPCCQSASVIGANSVWLTGVLADSVAVGSGNAPVGAGTKVGGGVMVGRTGLGLTVGGWVGAEPQAASANISPRLMFRRIRRVMR